MLLLGLIPNPTVQAVASITWMIGLAIGGIATLVALALWLGGVGASPLSDQQED